MYKLITNNFNLQEIRHLCELYGEHYDNLRGETKQGKALALFDHARRRQRIADLARAAAQIREDLDWSPWGGPGPVLSLHRALAEMLMIAFSSEEIRTLAFDLSFENMPVGVGKNVMVDALVDHTIRNNLVERILMHTKRRNPARFNQWEYVVKEARNRHVQAVEPIVSKSGHRSEVCPTCGRPW